MLFFIKSLFNKLFKEDTKNKLRRKFEKYFCLFDKKVVYRGYLKAFKYILNVKINNYSGPEYGYRYDSFLDEVRKEYIKNSIMHEMLVSQDDEEWNKCITNVRENGLDMYCGMNGGGVSIPDENIGYDMDNELFYGIYGGKKLYLSKEFDTKEKAIRYLEIMIAEQSEHSPHKYLTTEFNVDNEDIVFDIGCADGNFALSIVDKAKEIYLFEMEEAWEKPLQLTFAPYMDKIHIIKKYVSKNSNLNNVSLDDFCKENDINFIGMLKMDVEGAEEEVLLGAKRLLQGNRIRKIAMCLYHKLKDEQNLGALLPNYKKTTSEGYMLGAIMWCQDIKEVLESTPPYFTRGIMRAELRLGE